MLRLQIPQQIWQLCPEGKFAWSDLKEKWPSTLANISMPLFEIELSFLLLFDCGAYAHVHVHVCARARACVGVWVCGCVGVGVCVCVCVCVCKYVSMKNILREVRQYA